MLSPAVTTNLQLLPLDAKNRPSGSLRCFFGMNEGEMTGVLQAMGEPSWRSRQLAEAMYRQRIVEVDAITTLPKSLRQKLMDGGWRVGRPRILQIFTSVDGTERYLIQGQSPDALTVETVWMPEGDEGETGDGSEAQDGAGRCFYLALSWNLKRGRRRSAFQARWVVLLIASFALRRSWVCSAI